MNRIILIGNGFDLAHGYKTGYRDFINWYWEQWGKRLIAESGKEIADQFCSFTLKDSVPYAGWYLVCSHVYHLLPGQEVDWIDLVNKVKNESGICDFKCNSTLFQNICKSIETKNWVDIENEYYRLLCNYIKASELCAYSLSELNAQLQFLQNLLAEYLISISSKKKAELDKLWNQMYSPIKKRDISISKMNMFKDFINGIIQQGREYEKLLYGYKYTQRDVDYFMESIETFKKIRHEEIEHVEELADQLFFPENILLLNFNYTDIADNYRKPKISIINHIHGKLNTPQSIIFGYGDELDEDYKELLKESDNECLRNIKSIKYLEASNYRDMLQFIESVPYQVYIMGHSCGNSDRTLLNTLFEHKNCVSIKPYYYQKEDGSDNYMEIVQNICRNFTDMKLMREIVVNKIFCETLPQVKDGGEY